MIKLENQYYKSGQDRSCNKNYINWELILKGWTRVQVIILLESLVCIHFSGCLDHETHKKFLKMQCLGLQAFSASDKEVWNQGCGMPGSFSPHIPYDCGDKVNTPLWNGSYLTDLFFFFSNMSSDQNMVFFLLSFKATATKCK